MSPSIHVRTPAELKASRHRCGRCTVRIPARCFAPVTPSVRLGDLPAARGRTVAVLGHEQQGIPADALEFLSTVVEIPMVGTGASLNVAVAGSLVLYKLAGLG